MYRFCFGCVIFLLGVSTWASNSTTCSLQVAAPACCNSYYTGTGRQIVSQCACDNLIYNECTSAKWASNCLWSSNPAIETDCANRTNSTSCYDAPRCSWTVSTLGSSCQATLCGPRACNSLSYLECTKRPDCAYFGSIGFGSCENSAYCSCARIKNADTYCPCLQDSASCESVANCFWDATWGCQDVPKSKSKSDAITLSMNTALSALIMVMMTLLK